MAVLLQIRDAHKSFGGQAFWMGQKSRLPMT